MKMLAIFCLGVALNGCASHQKTVERKPQQEEVVVQIGKSGGGQKINWDDNVWIKKDGVVVLQTRAPSEKLEQYAIAYGSPTPYYRTFKVLKQIIDMHELVDAKGLKYVLQVALKEAGDKDKDLTFNLQILLKAMNDSGY